MKFYFSALPSLFNICLNNAIFVDKSTGQHNAIFARINKPLGLINYELQTAVHK